MAPGFEFAASGAEQHALEERYTCAIELEFARFAGQRKAFLERKTLEDAARERARAELAAKIGRNPQLSQQLDQKRRNVPWRPALRDWKLNERIISAPCGQFGMEALVARVENYVVELARALMIYERSVVTGVVIEPGEEGARLAREQREAHAVRARGAIMSRLFPKIRNEPAPRGMKAQRLVPLPFADFYVRVDENDHVLGLEVMRHRSTTLERPAVTNLWGFRYFPRARRQFQWAVFRALNAEIVEIVKDDRSRDQMVAVCKTRWGLPHDSAIYKSARLPSYIFYRWRKGDPGTGSRSEGHRHLMRVFNSPVWPPLIEW